MNLSHQKLHIVLTAKAKHAEFKCALCKKLFISGYHLNRHRFRRHSHYFENLLTKQEPAAKYTDAFEGRSNSQALNASRRMEKLLKNLTVEENQLLSINRFSSTPFNDKPIRKDHFSQASILSPINSISYLDGLPCKKLPSNYLHQNSFSVEKIVENNYAHIKTNHIYDRQNSFIDKKATVNLVKDKEKSDKSVFVEYVDLIENSNKNQSDEKFFDEGLRLILRNRKSNTEEIIEDNKTVHDNSVQATSDNVLLKFFDVSTQTEDPSTPEKSNTFTQTCRFADDFPGDLPNENERRPPKMIAVSQQTENQENLDFKHAFNKETTVDLKSKNSFLESKLDALDINEVNDSLEKDFQESFDARKNLLAEEDFNFITVDNFYTPPEEMKLCDSVIDLKHKMEGHCELESGILNVEKDLDKTFGFINNEESIKQREVQVESDHNTSLDKRYSLFLKKIECSLSVKLRSLGVDPNWTGISNKVADKTNSLLTIRRINISKKVPRYMSMRKMLNNTVDQILESKDE